MIQRTTAAMTSGNKTSLVSGPLLTNTEGDFVDSIGRKVTLKGINLDTSSKLPTIPQVPSHTSADKDSVFWDGDNVTFVGRPFPLDQAEEHIRRIKSWGYNIIRYVITWEAIEHGGPGVYDEDFVEYTEKVLLIIHDVGGLYVFLDPHQDVWSRFTGGSGAPLWTLYAAGLDPRKFEKTHAAVLHGHFPADPDAYPKMLWPLNYYKLAAATMFTLFFSGRTFAPKAVIDGVNIQDYLQNHFVGAFKYLVERLYKINTGLFDETIFGFEMLNEPNCGWFGAVNFSTIPESQRLRVAATPTLLQTLRLGMGMPETVDEYKITITGPRKTGTVLLDPQGETAWLDTDDYDEAYGFKRDPGWKLGTCIWAEHGLWDVGTGEILDHDFFSVHPETGVLLDKEYFVNNNIVDFFVKIKDSIRKVKSDLYILLHSPVLEVPPKLIGTEYIDDRIIYAPHYYDGLSLMMKSWNRTYNVDTLGIMRGRYLNPVFAIVLGETNIRKCLRSQFQEIKKEGQEYLGKSVPIIMTETGMPFDMDNKQAYQDGNYDSQTRALDALSFALEGSDISHTFWGYCSINSHKWGDQWNCEDFSFWSKQDKLSDLEKDDHASNDGVRAVGAVIRPYVLKSNGPIVSCEFEREICRFLVEIDSNERTLSDSPTVIYLPDYHFQLKETQSHIQVIVSSGNFEFDQEKSILSWFHSSGPQKIEISNTLVEKSTGQMGLLCNALNGLFY